MTKESIVELLLSYFPRRWFRSGSHAKRLLSVIAAGVIYAFSASDTLRRETLTKTSVDSLDEKEKMYGLPIGESLPIEERRNRIRARRWQRGGPTNKEQFSQSLTLLAGGSRTFILPTYASFEVLYDIQGVTSDPVNLVMLQDYVRRNKLAHLEHGYRIEYSLRTVEITYETRTSMVEQPLCGTFYPEA